MKDQVIVITGATDGIGKVAARELSKKGYATVLVGRNIRKLESTKEEFLKLNPQALITIFQADLSLLKETKRVGKEILNKFPKIYCLLNNAGAFFADRTLTTEGLESTFALNHMNYFILSHELLPALQNHGKARIVNVASGAHVGVTLDKEDLLAEKNYSGWKQYQRSKLMNIYFTQSLSEKVKTKGITVNCLHPGFVKTKFGHNNEGLAKTLVAIGQNLFAINEDKGAATSIYLADSKDIEAVTGKYFVKSKESKSSKQSHIAADREYLWDYSEKIAKSILGN